MKKIIKALTTIILVFIISAVAINIFVVLTSSIHLKTSKDIKDEFDGRKPDCILVLGTAVRPDGTPGPLLKQRLNKALELYKLGVSNKLLLSGDNGQVEYNEVEAMKNYMLQHGVNANDIFLDHAGFSTYESMYRAHAVFGVNSAVIVTHRFHEYRAIYIARRLGINAYGVANDEGDRSIRKIIRCREYAARIKDFFTCIYKPKPTYLGNTISLSGSGIVSWS